MEKFIIGLVSVLVIIALMSLLGGTIVFLIWPIAIPAAFPGLVTSGVLAGKLSWWSAVCLTWVFAILIKSSQTNNNK